MQPDEAGNCTNGQQILDVLMSEHSGDDDAKVAILEHAIKNGHVEKLNDLIKKSGGEFELSYYVQEHLLSKGLNVDRNGDGGVRVIANNGQISQSGSATPSSSQNLAPFGGLYRDLYRFVGKFIAPITTPEDLFQPQHMHYVSSVLRSASTPDTVGIQKKIIAQAFEQNNATLLQGLLDDQNCGAYVKEFVISEAVRRDHSALLTLLMERPNTEAHTNIKKYLISETLRQEHGPLLKRIVTLLNVGEIQKISGNQALQGYVIAEAFRQDRIYIPQFILGNDFFHGFQNQVLEVAAQSPKNRQMLDNLIRIAFSASDKKLITNILRAENNQKTNMAKEMVFSKSQDPHQNPQEFALLKEIITGNFYTNLGFETKRLDLRNFDLSRKSIEFLRLTRHALISGANLPNRWLGDVRYPITWDESVPLFRGRDLSNVNFNRSNLSWQDFSGCRLDGADLRNTDLSEVRISDAESVRGLKINQKSLEMLPFSERVFMKWHINVTGQVKLGE